MKLYDESVLNNKDLVKEENKILDNEVKSINNIFNAMEKLLYNKDFVCLASKVDRSDEIPFKHSMSYLSKYKYIFTFIAEKNLWKIFNWNDYFYSSCPIITINITPAIGEFSTEWNFDAEEDITDEIMCSGFKFYVNGKKNHTLIKTKINEFLNKVETLYNGDNPYSCYANDTLKKDSDNLVNILNCASKKVKEDKECNPDNNE